ncbi:hypothetical protein SS21_24130 [Enterobacter roggenkampii]|uniref:hypothetical protein n=1 Tax=Enterobacter roggenkampii TaxID=1812935 RepID=UPI0005ED9C24|nr:hypothetical protein [Enterobacter roggenkampii]KJM84017.1 hypothetical protein SS21_24130 [Enterobacter roggenkampii]KJN50895.1 hypothetical protein SS51_24590 [Enterobacter roggenkampii]MDQ2208393.1 hypothetical protein [Enterobacter roggenkampii]WIJ50102.1 hypothetical protein OI984_04305 [Enterobacter roggenkampii]WIJ80665.1 hypothetical protein OI980_10805 [Enterobacter roggenkampii]
MIKKGYKLPHEFPNESFIQEHLEKYFQSHGYTVIPDKPIDLKCIHESNNETWVIEVKGKTTQIGLDFKTCLGQLLMRMNNPEINYAIAMPDIESYHLQTNKVPKFVFKKLNLSFFFINKDGIVTLITNSEYS